MSEKKRAEIVYEGVISNPLVQPGMLVTYKWVDHEKVGEKDLSNDKKSRLEKFTAARQSLEQQLISARQMRARGQLSIGLDEYTIKDQIAKVNIDINNLLSRPVEKSTNALVTRVQYDSKEGEWYAQLESRDYNFRRLIPAGELFPVTWADEQPEVFADEIHEIDVPEEQKYVAKVLSSLKSFIPGQKTEPKTRRIQAKVVTANSLSKGGMVYLTCLDNSGLFAIGSNYLDKQGNGPRRKNSSLPAAVREATSEGAKTSIQGSKVPESHNKEGRENMTPKQISEYLSQTVRGQSDAVKTMSVAIYDHHVRPVDVKKSNVIIIGPTGTGKTALASQSAELFGVPFVETKMSGKSASGYKGTNLESMFSELHKYQNHPSVDRSVIFLDEVDKLAQSYFESSGFGTALQDELIGWIESAKLQIPQGLHTHFGVDTTNMLFVAAGAFAGSQNQPGLADAIAKRLGTNVDKYAKIEDRQKHISDLYSQVTPEDLITYGFKPELVGRFPYITQSTVQNSIKRLCSDPKE